jgi:hypothetical protein
MILLMTLSPKAAECAEALHQATNETIQIATSLRQAGAQLRALEYSVVLVDQALLEAEPDESEAVLEHIGTALPVYINFAISGIPRVLRELRVALHRRKREAIVALQEAEQTLRNELKGPVTALLLSCEMALQQPDIPAAAQAKMRAVYDLAQGVSSRLGNS